MAKTTQRKKFTARAVAAMRIAEVTTTTLAREFGCHRNSVIYAIYKLECPRVHNKVCHRLGLKPVI